MPEPCSTTQEASAVLPLILLVDGVHPGTGTFPRSVGKKAQPNALILYHNRLVQIVATISGFLFHDSYCFLSTKGPRFHIQSTMQITVKSTYVGVTLLRFVFSPYFFGSSQKLKNFEIKTSRVRPTMRGTQQSGGQLRTVGQAGNKAAGPRA